MSSVIEESKHCNDKSKKYFNKELVMAKEDSEEFENSTKCLICDNAFVDGDVKVRDHCHITENIEALHIKIVPSILN